MISLREIKSRDGLASYLNISRNSLNYILYNKKVDNLYHSFEIPKKSGGMRHIYAPEPELKYIQTKLAEKLYDERKDKRNKSSHGFEKERDIYTNARIHTKKRYVYNIDLENFFESFHFGRVRGYFHKNKNFELPLDVATIIAQLSCYSGFLPQGSPCSPIITNFICEIFDFRVLKIARKYRLDYTRYADDMTFSTNNKYFINNLDNFYSELKNEVENSGFKINNNKTRIQDKYTRQVVTGLVVNRKINISRDYYKDTRAMAHSLYKNGIFEIDGIEGTINQLEGRFSFINQIKWKNNKKENFYESFKEMKGREKEYQKFIFYKYFISNPKPLVVVEGKTDILYLKAALKKMYRNYPNLISKKVDGTFVYHISFLNKSQRLKHFLGVNPGGIGLKNIYNHFKGEDGCANYSQYFYEKNKTTKRQPVILIYDNEFTKGKPINQLNLSDKIKRELTEHLKINIVDNLHLMVTPICSNRKESEMEDLFDDSVLNVSIKEKTFTRKHNIGEKNHFGKHYFSEHVYKNYKSINFKNFIPMLNALNDIVVGNEV